MGGDDRASDEMTTAKDEVKTTPPTSIARKSRTCPAPVKTPAILDAVQQVREVFAFVRSRIDRHPRRAGQWLLTGRWLRKVSFEKDLAQNRNVNTFWVGSTGRISRRHQLNSAYTHKDGGFENSIRPKRRLCS